MRRITIPKIFRTLFMLALLVMVALGVLSMFSQTPTPEESLQQTVDAGVRARSTELAMLTGTPDATQVQATVNAIVDATMTAANAPRSTDVPLPDATQIQQTVEAIVDVRMTAVAPQVTPAPASPSGLVEQVGNAIVGILNDLGILSIVAMIIAIVQGTALALWNLAGVGGFWMQVCCCILIPGILFIAMLRDS